ncbi:MAG: hypothetical protein EB145_17980 [Proteobacteria bacterium]|nr:hypothetical protein [Pseudomonadota bacterium]
MNKLLCCQSKHLSMHLLCNQMMGWQLKLLMSRNYKYQHRQYLWLHNLRCRQVMMRLNHLQLLGLR